MKFDTLQNKLGKRDWFDLATAVLVADEPRPHLQTQLYRWCRAGKLLPLRRGMYAFAECYRRTDIEPAALANHLYSPSYLSLQWALSWHGLIPERAVTFTSVATRQTRQFRNDFGAFTYRHLKPECFFGHHTVTLNGHDVCLARPEKALLDLWHLEPGAWDEARMSEMRFQNTEILDLDLLAALARRWGSPRLGQALDTFTRVITDETEGTVEL